VFPIFCQKDGAAFLIFVRKRGFVFPIS